MAMVDILLPVRNGAAFLDASIRSIVAQEMSDWRLLVLDHGSTDATPEIIGRYAAADGRIEHHRIVNADSLGALLNQGFDRSSAPFVARQDADDLSTPDRLACQIAALTAEPALAVVGSDYTIIDEGDRRIGRMTLPSEPDRVAVAALFCNPIAHPATTMRRRQLNRHRARYDAVFLGPAPALDPTWAEDYLFFGQLAIDGLCRNIPRPLIRYRRHGASVGATKAATQRTASHAIGRYLMQQVCARAGHAMSDPTPFSNHAGLLGPVATPLEQSWQQIERTLRAVFGEGPAVRREIAFRRLLSRRAGKAGPLHAAAFALSHRLTGDERATLRSWAKARWRQSLSSAA